MTTKKDDNKDISLFLKILFATEVILAGALFLYIFYWVLMGKK